MFALIVVGCAIAGVFTYEQWITWRRTTAWRRAHKPPTAETDDDDGGDRSEW
jgi:hypothetical protein